ncbi:MAG: hypothetical protein M1820_001149 [Bogoriella megaspora]|nr:MAG: hypothetical protein M1820_001149 [Bogoriella megaspora]
MPPKRRTSSSPVAKNSQSTLSFHNKNRITKPSATSNAKDTKGSKIKQDPALLTPPVSSLPGDTHTADSQISDSEIERVPTTSEAAILRQAEKEKERIVEEKKSTPEEDAARKLSDAKIKAYWREKERGRLASRVHQGDLSLEEKVLREFDMSGQYGPSIGIARLSRWQRAHGLGLKPPLEVLAVLLKEQEKENFKAQRSRVDELMASRFVET